MGYDARGNLGASPGLALTYNGIAQTTAANGTSMAYAGSTRDERVTVGPTTQRNGILGVQSETNAGATTYYERDPRGTLIAEHTPAAGDYDYVADGLGSVVALVEPGGSLRATYSSDPFGSHATATPANGTLPPNPFRFAGGYLDPSGLYHFGARFYDPALGRWTQQDSINAIGDPSRGNRYVYSGDDPVNRVDSGGRDGIDDVDNTLSDAQDDIVATVVGGMAGKAAAAASPVAAGVAGCLGGEAGDRLSKWASGKKAKTNVRTLARKCVEGIVGTVVAP